MDVVPLGSCDRRYDDAEVGVLLADTANVRDKVSLKTTIILYTNLFFSPGFRRLALS